MTLGELKEEIDYLIEHEGVSENVSVLFASQPNWPFEYDITSMRHVEDEKGNISVYMEEGSQLGYLDENAKEAIGW